MDGVAHCLVEKINRKWNETAGYKEVELDDSGDKFSVIRRTDNDVESTTKYVVDIGRGSCSCGIWDMAGP